MITTLEAYNLETNFEEIKRIPIAIWRNLVTTACENKNKERILTECHKEQDGKSIPKTKTTSIIEELRSEKYTRKPINEIMTMTKCECRTLIIARFGMLACGKNFKGTMSEQCNTCNKLDDEEHRMNDCRVYRELNHIDTVPTIPFDLIYSHNSDEVKTIMSRICKVWNTKTGKGTMNQ